MTNGPVHPADLTCLRFIGAAMACMATLSAGAGWLPGFKDHLTKPNGLLMGEGKPPDGTSACLRCG